MAAGGAPPITDEGFRDWLRELRERAGMTQEELGAAVGTDRRNVRRWEVDGHDPAGTMLLKVLGALGVRLSASPPRALPGAVNAELLALRRDLRELADRAASRHEELVARLDEQAEELRFLRGRAAARRTRRE